MMSVCMCRGGLAGGRGECSGHRVGIWCRGKRWKECVGRVILIRASGDGQVIDNGVDWLMVSIYVFIRTRERYRR